MGTLGETSKFNGLKIFALRYYLFGEIWDKLSPLDSFAINTGNTSMTEQIPVALHQ